MNNTAKNHSELAFCNLYFCEQLKCFASQMGNVLDVAPKSFYLLCKLPLIHQIWS